MKKIIFGSIIGIVIVIIAFVVLKFVNLKSEFNKYLKETYPKNTFEVKFPRINIWGSLYYSDVTCVENSTTFGVYKSFGYEKVEDNLLEMSNEPLDNKIIQDIFNGTDVEKYISSDSNGIKFLDENNPFHSMNLIIISDGNEAEITKKIFNVLMGKQIKATDIFINYSKDQIRYGGSFSDKDYLLTIDEIQEHFVKIK